MLLPCAVPARKHEPPHCHTQDVLHVALTELPTLTLYPCPISLSHLFLPIGLGNNEKAHLKGGLFHKLCRRSPNLPHTYACSTIGPTRLNFRVRDGNGWDPRSKLTGNIKNMRRSAIVHN